MRKRNKENAYRSKSELNFARWLESRGNVYVYEPCKFDYTSTVTSAVCNSCGSRDVVQHHKYTPDFAIYGTGEHTVPVRGVQQTVDVAGCGGGLQPRFYLECKGRFTSRDRRKMRDVKKSNPTLALKILLFSDNKITKNKPERYSSWCEKFGFDYCIKELPEDWLK